MTSAQCQDRVPTPHDLGPNDGKRQEIGSLRTNFDKPLDFSKDAEATESRTRVWKHRRSSEVLERQGSTGSTGSATEPYKTKPRTHRQKTCRSNTEMEEVRELGRRWEDTMIWTSGGVRRRKLAERRTMRRGQYGRNIYRLGDLRQRSPTTFD